MEKFWAKKDFSASQLNHLIVSMKDFIIRWVNWAPQFILVELGSGLSSQILNLIANVVESGILSKPNDLFK